MSRLSPLRLSAIAAIVTAVLGMIEAYALRSLVDASSVAYPSLAHTIAVTHGARGLLDGYWQPLWPLLLAVPQVLYGSSAGSAIVIAHGVAAVCLIGSCLAFHCLVRELITFRHEAGFGSPAGSTLAVLSWWSIFAFLTVRWAHPGEITPDPLAGLFVVLTALALLRLAGGGLTVRTGAALGAAAVASWLTSAPLLILVGGTAAAVIAVSLRRRNWRAAVGFGLVVMCVCVPYTVALSVRIDRPTIGEAARYVAAWEVDGLVREYWWAGQVRGFGVPSHPPRTLAREPLTLGFLGDPRADGAPPFESTWWNAGLVPPFRPAAHLTAVKESVRKYAGLVPGPFLAGVIVLVGLVAASALRTRALVMALRRSALVALPMLLVPTCLLFVETQQRMVAMPLAIGCVVVLAASEPCRWSRLANSARWVLPILLVLFAAKQPLSDLVSDFQGRPIGGDQLEIAHRLEAGGVRKDDGVAAIDRVNADGWVGLGSYRVVGIVVSRGEWLASDQAQQSQALAALRATGARAVVAEGGPGFGPPWIAVAGGAFAIRFLTPR